MVQQTYTCYHIKSIITFNADWTEIIAELSSQTVSNQEKSYAYVQTCRHDLWYLSTQDKLRQGHRGKTTARVLDHKINGSLIHTIIEQRNQNGFYATTVQ